LLQAALAMAVVVASGRVLGLACRSVGQPPVIGEMVAGIVLGPSLLGLVAPAAMSALFPLRIMPVLEVAAQIGVVLYMFVVGLELDLGVVGERLRTTIVTAAMSIAMPLALGASTAVVLYAVLAEPGVPVLHFALFLGVAMSITAFPVLARILTALGMTGTPIGALALACAAVNDVAAWVLLAFISGMVRDAAGSAQIVGAATVAFILITVGLVRPLYRKLCGGSTQGAAPSRVLTGSTLVALVVAALVAEIIGIHAVFGAFLLGAVIPHDSRLAHGLTRGLSTGIALLLPAFFALTGLRTQIGLMTTPGGWALCVLLIAVATAGKLGGTAVGARLSGLDWRQSATLGVLMNTRGLMELIVLNVGLELGVISPRVFTMLALMAIVTTMMTAPALRRLLIPPKAGTSSR
jgi:Kef-type K+ transport system membrane component KefB